MDFSITQKPIDPGKSNTSVKGQYNPAASMGGALTGDHSDLRLNMGICLLTIGIICYSICKMKIKAVLK